MGNDAATDGSRGAVAAEQATSTDRMEGGVVDNDAATGESRGAGDAD